MLFAAYEIDSLFHAPVGHSPRVPSTPTAYCREMSQQKMSIEEHLSDFPLLPPEEDDDEWNDGRHFHADREGPSMYSGGGLGHGATASTGGIQHNPHHALGHSPFGHPMDSSHSPLNNNIQDPTSHTEPILRLPPLPQQQPVKHGEEMRGDRREGLPSEPMDVAYPLLNAASLQGVDPSHFMIGMLPSSSSGLLGLAPSTANRSMSEGSIQAMQAALKPDSSRRSSRASHDGTVKCPHCPKRFTEQTLKDHLPLCAADRPHQCPKCSKRFKARGGKQQHMRIHDNKKPFLCSFSDPPCNRRFTQKSHLDQHMRIHTNEKPFTCEVCGRAFRQRSQQIGHQQTHANQATLLPSSSSPHHLLPSSTPRPFADPSSISRRTSSAESQMGALNSSPLTVPSPMTCSAPSFLPPPSPLLSSPLAPSFPFPLPSSLSFPSSSLFPDQFSLLASSIGNPHSVSQLLAMGVSSPSLLPLPSSTSVSSSPFPPPTSIGMLHGMQ